MTGPACQWTALSEANFITVTGGSSGTGNAPVAFTVAANIDTRPGFLTPARSGVIRIGGGARSYRLAIAETTLWANWFFTGSEYSLYTTLRNTSDLPVGVIITWRTASGVVAGSTTVIIPSKGGAYYDARTMAPAAVTGSVEIAHDGPPKGIVGSQSTLSPTAGIAFDSVLMERRTW